MLLAVCFAAITNAQLSGTKSIPGDYATIASAVTDLNTQGVGAGGVIFNVTAGHAETITATISVTATGTLANPIVFQKSGAGANPLLTAYTGGTALHTTTALPHDGLWRLVGSDYITIDGIDLAENAANTGAAMMEYGYALLKASTTDGSQNNTIKNCTITLNRTNSTTGTVVEADNGATGIWVANTLATGNATLTITSAAGANSNNKFYTNTIQNCNTGIYLRGFVDATPFSLYDQNNDIGGVASATGNTIINYGGGGVVVSAHAIRGIYQNGFNYSFNTINSNNGSGVNHTSTLRGIFMSTATSASGNINNNTLTLHGGGTTSASAAIESNAGSTAAGNTININNNIVQNSTYTTATSATFTGIDNGGTAATVNMNNNVVTNNTLGVSGTGTSGTFTPITTTGAPTSVVSVNNNTVTNNTKNGTSGTMHGISVSSGVVTVNGNTISGNTINLTGTSFCTLNGINNSLGAGTQETYSNNAIFNQTISSATTSASHLINGILLSPSSASTKFVNNNTIYNLQYTNSSTGSVTITGINHTTANTVNIFKNKIYGLTASNGASSSVIGITHGTTTTTSNIYNNLIGNLTNAQANLADAIRGISITNLTTSGTNNVSYNTVYINASSSGALFGTTGIFHSTSTTATTGMLNLRNNIIVNTSTPNGATGFTVAYRRSSTTLTNYGSVSNNNLFYAGTPSANKLIFYDGTNSDQLLATYKTRVTPRDANSVTENPPFLSLVGGNANFLQIDPTIATQVESGAAAIGGITDDYDGDTRNATTPDIGADEFAGISADLNPPTISYSPLNNTCTTTGVTLNATITDASGVPTSGIGLPVLYWNINGGGYTAATGVFVSGNNYNFTFGAGVVAGDNVFYYIVAQDLAATPNVGAFPSAGASGFTANPPAASTAPTTPSSFTIQLSISGTYPVGVGQSGSGGYETITAAVTAYNTSCLTGAVIFSLTDATYPTETYPITVNANSYASATNTLTIKPAVGISPTISGVMASNFLFRINGNYVIFDGSNTVGGTTRDMTITNTATTAPSAILYASTGTTPNVGGTVKNTILINGLNTTSNIVVGGSGSTPSTATTGYSNNFTFQNNSSRFTNHGIFITLVVGANNGNGTLITGNDFAGTSTNAIKQSGITLVGVDGATVSNNTIGNLDQSTIEIDKGIWLQSGTINTTVSGNTISTLGFNGVSASGNAYGIWVASANATSGISIVNNTLSEFTSTGAATGVGTTGIYVSGATAGVTIENNIIQNMKNTNINGFGASGIQLSSSSATANIVVKNNMISDIAGYGKVTAGVVDNGYGIVITGGAGYSLYYNSIHLNTDQILVGGVSSAINITSGVSATGAIDLRNNIFANSQTVGTERYAIYSGAPNTIFSTIDYNDYYTTGPNLGFIGSNRATLGDIQAGFGGNINSENVLPLFTSATNLHLLLAGNTGLDGQGTPIAGITTDIDGDTRNVTTPDLGADEFTPAAGVDMGATALVSPAASGCYTATETVTVTIRNYSTTSIDFAVDNVTVNVTATGGYSSSVVLTSGTLASGASQNVTMPATIDMSVNGLYTFNANTVVAGDIAPANNAMAPALRNVAALAGTKTVGVGGDYTTLTAAVAAYNSATCFTGPVVFSLIDAIYSSSETFPIVINASAVAGTNTLTIRPATGVAATITGTSGASVSALIKLNGADYIIFDGVNAGGSSLTVENTSVTAGTTVFWVSSNGVGLGASNNTIRNCSIKAGIAQNAATSTTYGIVMAGSTLSSTTSSVTAGDDNDNNTIQGNTFTKVRYAVYTRGGATTNANTGTIILNNTFGPSAFGADQIGKAGILIREEDGIQITGNTIQFVGGDYANTSAGSDRIAIAMGTDASWSGSVAPTSVYVKNALITRNNIHDIVDERTFTAAGIVVTGADGANATNNIIANNMMFNIKANGTAGDQAVGIAASSGNGDKLVFNSIYFTGDTDPNASAGTPTVSNFGLSISTTSVTNPVVKNNIIYMDLSSSSAPALKNAAINIPAAFAWGTGGSDYNDLYILTANTQSNIGCVGGSGGTFYTTLATWQAAVTQDVNSLNILPNFLSATNLHLVATSNCGLDGAGTPIAGITTDYDAQTRDVTTPDIGADEFTATYSGTLAGIAGSAVCENKAVSVSGTTYATSVCDLIARVLPSGTPAVSGKINVCVTLDAAQLYFNGEPYVQRHHDIAPLTNPTTSTATISLYFTDAEFMLYNSNNPARPPMPTLAGGGSTDPNRANILVTEFHGTPTTTPSKPGFYSLTTWAVINPVDANITFNGSYWTVTFDITGFGGFYIHSNIFGAPLPITINYFTGAKQGSTHVLNWKVTCTSTPRATMILERSADSRNFSNSITSITADAARCNQPFSYTDAQPLPGMNYYRLKMIDADGKVTYSSIVALLNAVKGVEIISIAPNPVTDGNFKLNISSAQASKMEISIIDMQGRLMNRQSITLVAGFNSIPMFVGNLGSGTYTIQGRVAGETTKMIRFVKE